MSIKVHSSSFRGFSEDDVHIIKNVILSDHPLMNYIKHPEFSKRKKMDKECIDNIPEFPSTWFDEKMSHMETVQVNEVENLLKPEEEKVLFLKYNYIRYRIACLRRKATKEGKSCLLKMLNLYKGLAKIEQSLVSSNLGIVVWISSSFRSKAGWNELISEGNDALLEAIRHFDINRNIKFSTLAWTSIRNALITFTNNKAELMRKEVQITSEDWNPEVKKDVDFSEKLLTLVRKMIDDNIMGLSEDEIEIIRMRYPSSNEKEATLEEIGKKIGVSRTAITNKIDKISKKMKSFLLKNSVELGISDEISY